jgi:hypothetical protein
MNLNPHLPRFDELRAEWAAATTERQRATVEDLMWKQAPVGQRKGDPYKWIRAYLSDRASSHAISCRRRCFTASSLADPLWDRIDGDEKMSYSTASRLLSEARKIGIVGKTPAEALAETLREYDKFDEVAVVNGKKARRRSNDKQKSARNRRHWDLLRRAIHFVVAHELNGVADPETRATLRSQIEVEISGLIGLLIRRVHKVGEDSKTARNGVKSAVNAERRSLKAACDILSIDRPKSGIVDHATLVKAKKNFRALAKEHHPDHGGSRERYQAVIEAMTTVEASFRRTPAPPHSTNNE